MNDINFTRFARNLRKNQTDAEKLLWSSLRNRQMNKLKFRRQYQIGRYIVDFICIEKRLVIELDGGQHNVKSQIGLDEARNQWFKKNEYRVLRFWDNDILKNICGVMEVIQSMALSPHPNPLPKEKE